MLILLTPPPPIMPPAFFTAIRLFFPVAISIASYGLVWGVLAGQAGLSPLEVVLMSGLVYAGSSQFVALTLWSPAALPIASIIVATAIINLRMLLMTATLRPMFAPMPRGRALLAMFLVSDEVWAMSMAEAGKGRGGPGFLLGAGLLAWLAWVGSTLAGRLLGAIIDDPATYGLDFAFTATFIALLFGMWKGPADLLPWIAGGLIAIAVSLILPGTWYIIAGGLGGSLLGAIAQNRRASHVS